MKNKKTIEQLFILFNNDMLKDLINSKKYKDYLNKINTQLDLLDKKLDESTLLIINNIMELQIDLLSLETAESFCNGFKLAIRLITESKE